MIVVKLVCAAAGVGVLALLARHGLRGRRRRRLLTTSFPDEWKRTVKRNVPLYRRLPEPLRQQLHGLVQVFIAEKRFEGCGGLEITDEIRVTVAAQACMLLLNRKTAYFPRLRTILVYPATYVARSASSDGTLVVEGRSVRLGESWQNGPVVLAWDSAKGGTSSTADAQNVVLHEFAHQLDQEDGVADGAPILEHRSRYITWARVLSAEYEALRRRRGYSVIDDYGATDPAEFFAVATETFFEKPTQMKRRHPALYRELQDYYRIDPAQWISGP